MNEQRHLLIFPVSLWNGMAGTRRIKVLVDELATKGIYSFSNLIISHPKEYRGHPETGSEHAIPFCKIGYTYYNLISWLAFWYYGFRFINQMRKRKQANFIYCYQETDIVTLPILLFARLRGYKIIVDIVEDNSFIESRSSNWIASIRVRSGIWLLKKLPFYADAAVAISGYLLKKTKEATNERIPVIELPISVNFHQFSSKTVVSGRLDDKKPFSVFYGGSFGPKDGLHYLLQAISLSRIVYPSIKLVLTGTGSPSDLTRFWDWVRLLELDDAIDYRGFLPDEEYRQTLHSCDLFCMTRTNSHFSNAGFPFKLGEMLAAGKPVIATKVGDIEKYLVDFENALLVAPENPPQIASRLIWSITNYSKALAIGLQGRQVAEKHFNAIGIASKLDVFLTELTTSTR